MDVNAVQSCGVCYVCGSLCQHHVAEAVVHHVKVGGVGGVGDRWLEGGGDEVQGSPVQTTEEGVASEILPSPGAQTLLPLTDQPHHERTRLCRHLSAGAWELKVILRDTQTHARARTHTHTSTRLTSERVQYAHSMPQLYINKCGLIQVHTQVCVLAVCT